MLSDDRNDGVCRQGTVKLAAELISRKFKRLCFPQSAHLNPWVLQVVATYLLRSPLSKIVDTDLVELDDRRWTTIKLC